MGKKVSPQLFRLGTLTTWSSRWFSSSDYREYLKEDWEIRSYLLEKYRSALLSKVDIERSAGKLSLTLHVGRAGVIIGRGGKGIQDLQEELRTKFFKQRPSKLALSVHVQEIRPAMSDARVVGLVVAEQLEKRMPFRRVLKQAIEQVQQSKGVEGVKISISGRLNNADMSRREWLSEGKIPLHTIRANVDFANVTATTQVGAHGIKVWIYKGEVFEDRKRQEDSDAPRRRPQS